MLLMKNTNTAEVHLSLVSKIFKFTESKIIIDSYFIIIFIYLFLFCFYVLTAVSPPFSFSSLSFTHPHSPIYFPFFFFFRKGWVSHGCQLTMVYQVAVILGTLLLRLDLTSRLEERVPKAGNSQR